MRIRGTKPEFWKSKRIASVSWDARLVLKGLESYVDDKGVGVDDIELIVTDVFPRDMFSNPRETVARVSEAITELHQAGLVHRYEANNDHLIYISFWESIQRIDKPGKGRNPRPDGTFDYKDSEIRDTLASLPVTLAPGTEEQRNRGTGEQGNRASAAHVIPADFTLTPERKEWATENTPAVNADRETEGFVDYWRGEQGKKKNWETTWRNWMRRKQTEAETKGWKPTGTFDPKNWMNQ